MSTTSIGRNRRLGWAPLRYSVDFDGDKVKIEEPPFVVAVIANLGGSYSEDNPPLAERNFKAFDVGNLNDVLKRVNPHLRFSAENIFDENDSPLPIELRFQSYADFRPENVIMQVSSLYLIYQLRGHFSELMLNLEINTELVGAFELWNLGEEKRMELLSFDFENNEDYSDLNSIPEAILGTVHHSALKVILNSWQNTLSNIIDFVNSTISELDEKLSKQVDIIIHHPEFQALESTWRGLEYLAREAEVSELLKLRVLNASKEEIRIQYDKSVEHDQSLIFKKLYDDEVNVLGGEPYGLIVCDFEVSYQREDINLLQNLSNTGSACRAPVLMSASPSLFSLESWQVLSRLRRLDQLFEQADYLPWRALRQTVDASFLSIVLPRLLARAPWDCDEDIRQHGFLYTESSYNDEHYCWMNGAFGLASVIVNAFARDRWCADLRGARWGRIEGITAHYILDNDEISKVVGPSEIDISEHRHRELESLGFVSLSRHRNGEFAALHTPISLAEPLKYLSKEANDSAYLAVQLEHQLCVGRVWNVIRSYLSRHSGQYDNWSEVVDDLNQWLSEYCVDDKKGVSEKEAVFVAPFKSVDVKVLKEDESQPSIQVNVKLNYIPRGEALASVFFVYPSPGMISCRLIP